MPIDDVGGIVALEPDELVFTIKDIVEDSGTVPLQTFHDLLGDLYSCLRAVEREAADDDQHVEYRVSRLSVSSAEIGIRIISTRPALGESIRRLCSDTLVQLESGAEAIDLGWEALERFGELGQKIGKRFSSLRARSVDMDLSITRAMAAAVEKILGQGTVAEGAVSGYLQQVNLHNQWSFHIYPRVGVTKILCTFDQSLMDAVGRGLNQYVTVHGSLHYRPDAFHPYRIEAKRVVPHPPSRELPTLGEMRGIAPEITDGMDAVSYLHKLRETA